MYFTKLQPLHMDFLKEIGNIGAGNAVTSLAQMTGKKIGMEVPSSSIARINHLMQLLGDEEELVSCVNVAVSGDAQASIFFILKHQSPPIRLFSPN
jgi:chemotaxis protein CheC